MTWHMEYLSFRTKKHRNITDRVAGIAHRSGIQEGMALVSGRITPSGQ